MTRSSMPQTCSVCRHANQAEIDRAIIHSESLRDIARQFGISKDAVARHKEHLPKMLVKAHDALEVARADALLDDIQTHEERLEGLYAAAESIAAREMRRTEPDANAQLRAI